MEQQSDAEQMWQAFISAMHKAYESLPELPRRCEADWVTEELRSLSKKQRYVWLCLSGDGKQQPDDALKAQYQHLWKLKKVPAEKARNAWWRARVVEAEKHARLAEQSGRGCSFLKELRMLASLVSKPSASTLLDREGRSLNSDSEKLQRWAEHFTGVVNCGAEINEATLETLPVVEVYPNGA